MFSSYIDLTSFLPKLFLRLYFGFILFTPIGTLLHEGGHYLVSKSFGYKATINYKSTFWSDPVNELFLKDVATKYDLELMKNKEFPGREKYMRIQKKYEENDIWITLGGPIQTMLFGTIGVFILQSRRLNILNSQKLKYLDWFFVFLSLFGLRQLANFIVWIGRYLLTGVFSETSDEIALAIEYGLPIWIITSFTAIVATAVLIYIIFKILPLRLRFTFIIAGFFGGISGYILWLECFGKLILP